LNATGVFAVFVFYIPVLCVSPSFKDGERCRIFYKKSRKGLFEDLFKRKISNSKGESPMQTQIIQESFSMMA